MRRAWFAAVMAVAGLIASPIRAEDPPAAPSQGPYVVLVGVGQYDDKAIEARPTAEADARALYDVFSDGKYFAAKPGRVVLLTSTPDEKRHATIATRDNIVKAIHEAVAKTGKDDPIILAWFGRGSSAGDKTALFAKDTVFKERAKTAVLGSELETELKAAKDRKLCLLMDVAYKGFDAGKEGVPDPTLRDVSSAVFGGEDRGEGPAPTDRVMFLATDLGHDSLTTADGKEGLFASVIATALKGTADTDGYEPDGLVTVDELAKFIEKELADQARTIGKTVKEKEALPRVFGEETSHFALTLNPKVTPTVEERLTKLADLEKNQKVTKEIAVEGKALLSRMPKLKAQQDLRKKFQALADGKLAPDTFATERTALKESLKLTGEETDRYARTFLRAADKLKDRYVKELNLGDLVEGGIRGVYRSLEEPLPTTLSDELKNAKTLSRPKLAELLREARERLGKREDLDDEKDVDATIRWMMASLNDDYTVYFDKELLKKTESQLRGEFSGVGIQIRRDSVRDGLLVVSPIKGSPAYKAGILAGDLIIGIKRDTDPEGKPLTADAAREISTKGMKTEKALEVILGKPGIPITIVVQREGEKEPKEFTITRGRVAVETVLGVKRDKNDDWEYYIDPETKIGYICLTQFSPATFRDLQATLKKLQASGLRGLILDLRFNPGGLLVSAAQVCDLFIDEGLVVSVRPRVGEEEQWFAMGSRVVARRPRFGDDPYPGRDGKPYSDFPMVILVNKFSASAAEIVSACLQDYNRAIVVGERSFGKGSVQSVEEFSATGGQMKMTTARYFPPLGRNIDKLSTPGRGKDEAEEWGVKPDKGFDVKLSREDSEDLAEHFRDREIIQRKDLPSKEKDAKPFKDLQLEKALEYIKGQLKVASGTPPRKNG